MAFAAVIIALAVGSTTCLAVDGGWDYQPYRVQAILTIDAPGGMAEQLAAELPEYLRQRVDSSLVPLWSFDLQLAAGVERSQVLGLLQSSPDNKPPKLLSTTNDKLILLAVQYTPSGFQ